jgi:hypothetical protein
MKSKTDAKGNYKFARVPLGTYALTFKDSTRWRYYLDKPIKALQEDDG